MSSSAQPSVTARVCEWIVACGRAPLDERLLPAARQLFLDGIAVGVAGARLEEAPRILAAHFADPLTGTGGGTAASLLGLDARLGTVPAALVNGAAMHVLDFEPMWLPATHALSPALAPVLALGETLGSSGGKILTAMVLGIEIQGRLRAAAGALESHELRFHPPGFVGPIGAAVAAGHLLDFDADQFANAIGIAGSRCGGLFVNLGTMTKATHCAYAAALGLEAALLTRRGFTGCPTLFDAAPQDYAQAFFPRGFDAEALLHFGQPLRIEDPGYAIKIFPAKFSTHYAITAALMARPQIPSPEAIRSVRITAADVPSSDRPHPRSGLDGKFSLQYTAAAALLDGHVGLASFTDERLARADMQSLLGKVETTLSRDIPSIYTAGRYLDLEVTLQDGSIVRTRCERPRGSWGAAPITADEHHAKARDCLATWLAPGAVADCIAQCDEIDSLDPQGVRALLRLASSGETAPCC
ncbi:MAG: MmgE/PrpD family protein [Acetobacteraceae bacterium]|jgi:aconitate decarboxylase